jgi:aromatic amino acid aminotransferase I
LPSTASDSTWEGIMAPPAAIEVTPVSDTTGVVLPNPLTAPVQSNDVYGRRKKTDRAQWGTAAPANTKNFRLRSHDHKPKSKSWQRMSYGHDYRHV